MKENSIKVLRIFRIRSSYLSEVHKIFLGYIDILLLFIPWKNLGILEVRIFRGYVALMLNK